MITSIATFFSGIAQSVAGYFKLKASANVQRREAEKDVRKAQEAAEEKEAAIDAAVHGKADDTVTSITHDLLCGLAVGTLVCSCLVYGCFSDGSKGVIYVAADQRIESCTNSLGIACKAVPDVVYAEMLKRLQELKDLKTEMKVDKRLKQ